MEETAVKTKYQRYWLLILLRILDILAPAVGGLSTLFLAKAFGPPPKDFEGFSVEIKIAGKLDPVTVNRPISLGGDYYCSESRSCCRHLGP